MYERGEGGERRAGRRWGLRALAAAGALSLIAAGCGGDDDGDTDPVVSTTTTSTTVAATATTTPEASGAMFIFDYLDGGSTTIEVYKGPGNDPEDKTVTAKYVDGESKPIACTVDGRPVPHHPEPEVGERDPDPDSDAAPTDWYRLAIAGEPRYATGTYGDPNISRSQIPLCP